LTNKDKESLMGDILYWMNILKFPTPALVYEGAHWVAITGFMTDIEPVEGSVPTFQYIRINDPFPTGKGAVNTMTATVWFETYWHSPVNVPGTWDKQYVGLIEPPVAEGALQTKEMVFRPRSGNMAHVISSKQALDYAQYWLEQLGPITSSNSSSTGTAMVAYEPTLVKEDIKPLVEKSLDEQVSYYLVPYTQGDTMNQGGVNMCLIVNAFTGDFEELTSFGSPVNYLDERGAIKAASRALGTNLGAAEGKDAKMEKVIESAKASVIFTPCDFTYLRAYPFWKVETEAGIVYVEMNGNTHFELPTAPAAYGK
jgi:hypothetical protein